MANVAHEVGIRNSWSLIAFARSHGKMQVGDFKNKETQEPFKSCIFTAPNGTRTFVGFSSKMGELTPAQIAKERNSLQVCELESGYYTLCRQGENSWEDVDLGI